MIRTWLNSKHGGQVPKGKIKDVLDEFLKDNKGEDVSYSSMNGTLKKVLSEGAQMEEGLDRVVPVLDPTKVKMEIIKVEDMDFPNFQLHNSGKPIDDLMSDHEKGGGLYGGTVTIVMGESGVGKSTILLDYLASVQKQNRKARVLYISSEMTKNDILFYHKKTPAIGQVPTLLLMDCVKDGTLSAVLNKAFTSDYDIILLDSFQDTLVKLKEAEGWRATAAESWLIGQMITAAEEKGCAILAIQHMTKGGTYVGSTYLKHATQAMMEIKFDISGHRYVEFTKNRRGGSAVGKRLYYSLDAAGEVQYDIDKFKEQEEMRNIERNDSIRRNDLTRGFDEMFKKREKKQEEEEPATVDEE